MGGVPSVGVFLRNPCPYLRVFLRKPGANLLDRQARPEIKPGTSRLQAFERRTAQPLVGPRMDNLTSMLYPGFEPGTFGAAAGFPSHYTAWSTKFKYEEEMEEDATLIL